MDTLIDVPAYGNLILHVLQDAPFPDVLSAQRLLLGTCAQESSFLYTRQLGGGPARGLMQIEPQTESSLWHDYLAYHPDLAALITQRCGQTAPNEGALEHGLLYGILLARLLYYWRDPAPLPAAWDLEEQARRWKRYYNTPAGAGTEAAYVQSYATLVLPHYPLRVVGY